MKAKRFLYTVAAGIAVGALIGIMYAPDKGAETRQKIRRLKQRFGIGKDDEVEDYDRETLHDLRNTLQEQLKKIDAVLEKDPA